MIECMSGLPDGTLGFSFQGQITADDYDHVLTPALDRALEQHDHLKLIAQLGPSFEGYDLGAAWADGREALRHWDGFERLALVSDVAWVHTAAAAFSLAMPCPVRVFANADFEDARRWLSESLGTMRLERHGDVIEVRLIGTIEASAYQQMETNIDAELQDVDGARLLLDLREFDGWAGLGALGRHMALVRDHRRAMRRVVVVGNKAWQALAEKLISQFVEAETRFFDAADYALAETWIRLRPTDGKEIEA